MTWNSGLIYYFYLQTLVFGPWRADIICINAAVNESWYYRATDLSNNTGPPFLWVPPSFWIIIRPEIILQVFLYYMRARKMVRTATGSQRGIVDRIRIHIKVTTLRFNLV